jgi:hypothetical protein
MIGPPNWFASGQRMLDGASVNEALNALVLRAKTLTDLRGLVGTGGSQAILAGSTAQGDGGGGMYYWSPTSVAADNGTTVVRPTGAVRGAWLRLGFGFGSPFTILGLSTAIADDTRWGIASPTFYDFGARGDGTGDDAAAINAAIAWSAANPGYAVQSGSGVFKILSRINLVSGARVRCNPGAIIRPAFNSAGSFGFISQAVIGTKITDVMIRDMLVSCADATTYNGNAFSFYGDKIRLENCAVDTWGGTSGRAFVIDGDQNRIINPRAVNPNPITGVGGIRVIGGAGFLGIGGYVESGDDVFQLVPAPAGALANHDISSAWFIGCSGKSFAARLMVAALVDQAAAPGVITMTCSIRDSGWIAVSGEGGARAGLIENKNSSGEIANIGISDTSLTGSDDTLPHTLYITSPATGGIRNINCRDVSILAPARHGLSVDGYVSGIFWNGGGIEAPLGGASYFAVRLNDLRTALFSNMTISGNGNEGALVGSASACYGIDFDRVTFDGIADGQFGINYKIANYGVARRCIFKPASGSTTAKAINFASTATGCSAENNDDTALPTTTNFTLANGHGHWIQRNQADTRRLGVGNLPTAAYSGTVTFPQAVFNNPMVELSPGGSDVNYVIPSTATDGDTIRAMKVDAGAGHAVLKFGGNTVATLATQGASVFLRYSAALGGLQAI